MWRAHAVGVALHEARGDRQRQAGADCAHIPVPLAQQPAVEGVGGVVRRQPAAFVGAEDLSDLMRSNGGDQTIRERLRIAPNGCQWSSHLVRDRQKELRLSLCGDFGDTARGQTQLAIAGGEGTCVEVEVGSSVVAADAADAQAPTATAAMAKGARTRGILMTTTMSHVCQDAMREVFGSCQTRTRTHHTVVSP